MEVDDGLEEEEDEEEDDGDIYDGTTGWEWMRDPESWDYKIHSRE